jgi:hypothetical protein
MRIAGLIAVTALVAACSQSVGGEAETSGSSPATPPGSTSTTNEASPGTGTTGQPPGESASIEDVIAWIEAGTPADAGAYHEAYLDGVTTRLGDDIAFTAPSGPPNETTQCLTDTMFNDGTLSCLLELTSPAPRPAGAEGVWKPGWVDFFGTTVQVGSLHGDPGPFVKGVGPQLAEGQSLAFGDNRCRSDATGLFCVNYAHRSAVWISAGGVVPFGCLQSVSPPPQTGAMFSC